MLSHHIHGCLQVSDHSTGCIIYCNTENLSGFLDGVNSINTDCMDNMLYIFDLQGAVLNSSSDLHNFVIKASNVTLKNATIMLGSKHSGAILFVDGRNVTLDNIIIIGGNRGVSVSPGGSVTMHDCTIQNAFWGVQVGGSSQDTNDPAAGRKQATFMAHKLQIVDFHSLGLRAFASTDVTLTECCITCGQPPGTYNFSKAVHVSGPNSNLKAIEMICREFCTTGLTCDMNGRASLECCTLVRCTGTSERNLDVQAKGSVVDLLYCTLRITPEEGSGVTEQVLVSLSGSTHWRLCAWLSLKRPPRKWCIYICKYMGLRVGSGLPRYTSAEA